MGAGTGNAWWMVAFIFSPRCAAVYLQICMAVAAFAAFAVFAVLAVSPVGTDRACIDRQGSSPFLGRLPIEFAYWLLAPVARFAARLELSPDVSSWTCLLLGIVSGIAAGAGAVPLAGALILTSALFDMLDGMVARFRGIASDAGEVLERRGRPLRGVLLPGRPIRLLPPTPVGHGHHAGSAAGIDAGELLSGQGRSHADRRVPVLDAMTRARHLSGRRRLPKPPGHPLARGGRAAAGAQPAAPGRVGGRGLQQRRRRPSLHDLVRDRENTGRIRHLRP